MASDLNLEFLDKLLVSYTSKIDEKILSQKKRLRCQQENFK